MNTKLRELEEIFLGLRRAFQMQSTGEAVGAESMENPSNYRAEDIAGPKESPMHGLDGLMREKTMLLEQLMDREVQLERLVKENSELKSRVKALRTDVIDMKGAIRVMCRIKPSGQINNIGYDDRSIAIAGKQFTVDRVFGQDSSQDSIFREVAPLVESILDGYKICVFAYGQTGSGKTYTMQGPDQDRGLVYRALDSIDRLSQELRQEGFTIEYKTRYLEIYNEEIRDLIEDAPVRIVHEGSTVRLTNSKEVKSSSIQDIQGLVAGATEKRAVGETGCNARSSRSHAVLILTVSVRSETEQRTGALALVDLAGSERLSESKAENERLRETQNINRSLSALGNVFGALRRRDAHIPFRDSKLTHLMQEYLTGESRTAMIVNINPENEGESICSLRLASRVSECELGRAERSAFKHK